jgi:hypothetical protein
VYVIAEASARQRERERYAPPEREHATGEAIAILSRAMRRREAEPLAIETIKPMDLGATQTSRTATLPLTELTEAGAEQASATWDDLRSPTDASRDALGRQREDRMQGRDVER